MSRTVSLLEAIEILSDDVPTVILPFFLTTPKQSFMDEVLRRIKKGAKTSTLSRIYLIYQEGVSEMKARFIWDELQDRASAEGVLENIDADSLEIYSFSNVPIDILKIVLEQTPHTEVV